MKSVLITGTSKGIGFETALVFARSGYRMHATVRNPAASPDLSEVAAYEQLPIDVTAMDVDNDNSVAAGVAAIQAKHGPVDILANNAGLEPLSMSAPSPVHSPIRQEHPIALRNGRWRR